MSPRTPGLAAVVVAALAAAVAVGGGCGVAVDGDFDGVPWTPDSAILAVADRQDLLVRGGAVVPVLKNEAAQTLDVLLTAARVDVTEDWRRATADELLEIKRDLATSDGILLTKVPLDAFQKGAALAALVENGEVSGDFDVAVGAALPPEDAVKAQGLGSKLRITVTPKGVDAGPHGGSMSAAVEVQREREAGQDGDVATGTVNLSFSTAFLDERLGESNLTVAQPVLECMQATGAARSGSCRDVDELPYIDETGVVDP